MLLGQQKISARISNHRYHKRLAFGEGAGRPVGVHLRSDGLAASKWTSLYAVDTAMLPSFAMQSPISKTHWYYFVIRRSITSLRRRKEGVHGGSKYPKTGDSTATSLFLAIHVLRRARDCDSFAADRAPLNRRTARRPAGIFLRLSEESSGAGACAADDFAGRTNAIARGSGEMKTGVVMAIDSWLWLLPEM